MKKANKAIPVLILAYILLILTPRIAISQAVPNIRGESSAPQIMLGGLAEPGSPVVGTSQAITDDLHFVVGYRLWLNWWQTTLAKLPTIVNDPHSDGTPNIVDITVRGNPASVNAFAAASVPTLGVRYKDFFASGSVMLTPDYDFGKTQEIVQGLSRLDEGKLFDPHRFLVTHKITGSRTEVDVNLGYYIHEWVALTAGYKGVFQKLKDKSTSQNLTHETPDGHLNDTSKPHYNGGTIGVAANIPVPAAGWIPAGFYLYGNGGGGGMASNDFQYALYGTVDAGLAYKPTSLPLLITLGYKFQIISSKTKSESKPTQCVDGAPPSSQNFCDLARDSRILDYTKGVILGINFAF